MNPMILSDKVADIIKELEVRNGIQQIALERAAQVILQLKMDIAQLKKQIP